jgi:hypothetical protein
MPFYLYLWALALAAIPAGAILRKPNVSYGALLLAAYLSIDVLIGLNTPNPNWIKLIQVVVP